MWTEFWDMHSGGGLKEAPYHYIYIEAPKDEAVAVFYARFGHNPYTVGCPCCGENYSVGEDHTLMEATAFQREKEHFGKTKGSRQSIKEFVKRPDVLIIRAKDIKPEERGTYVPEPITEDDYEME